MKRNENNNKTIKQVVSCTHESRYIESRIFASSIKTRKTGIDEGKYGFYRVIRSQIFRVLMTLFGKMASLSYNKGSSSIRPHCQNTKKYPVCHKSTVSVRSKSREKAAHIGFALRK